MAAFLKKRRDPKATLAVGSPAPDFTLPATGSKKPLSLSSYRGSHNVVLLFFPFAFTGVCENELCSVRDSLAEYEALDAVVLAISADSPFVLEEWASREGFGFPLLSDFNREVAPLYDSLYQKLGNFVGVPRRSAFVIDKQGRVRYREVCPSPGDQPSFSAIRAALAEAG